MLNSFAANVTRMSSFENDGSPRKTSTTHVDAGNATFTSDESSQQLSPIQLDALPSDASVVDLYTQLSTKSKPMYAVEVAPKPVCNLT